MGIVVGNEMEDDLDGEPIDGPEAELAMMDDVESR